MKANELMIGDWVIHGYYKTPIQIKSIPNAEQIYHPIPLTPEILEKNGFVQDYSYDECIADGCFIEVKGWTYKAENILIQWDGITCEITNDFGNPCEEITLHGENYEHDIYVHELQHALRLCGLNDLADNFKV